MFRSIRTLLALGGKKIPVSKPSKFFQNTRIKLEALEDRTSPAVAITSDGGATIVAKQVVENTTFVSDVNTDAGADPASGPPGAITYSLVDFSGSALQKDKFSINATTGVLTFTGTGRDFENPQGNNGTNEYYVNVRAASTGASPGGFDEQLFVVEIINANDPPVGVNDTLTAVNEDSGARNIPFADLLANDLTGPAGSNDGAQTLTVIGVANASGGTVSLDTPNSRVIFTPNANFNGTASFTYTIQDSGPAPNTSSGTTTASFTVTAVNDAPVALNGSLTAQSSTTTTGTLVASDIDNDPLTYIIVDQSNAHGTVTLTPTQANPAQYTYTPTQGYSGPASFTFRASDGQALSNIATISITVNFVNHAPDAQDGTLTVPVNSSNNPGTLVATDADGDVLLYTLVSTANANGTVVLVDGTGATVSSNTTGAYRYTPTPGFNGLGSFTFRAADPSGLNDTATISITVGAGNAPPVAQDGTLTTNEDTAATGTLVATDINPGTTLTYTIVGTSNAHGTVTLIDGSGNPVSSNTTGAYRYTPDGNFNGSASFLFIANDGNSNSNVGTIAITVNAVNDAPTITNKTLTINEGATVALGSANISAADVDNTPSQLTFTASSITNGQFELVSASGTAITSFTQLQVNNGEVRFVHNGSENAPTFSLVVSDGNLDSGAAQAATINFTKVNEAPVAQDIPQGTLSTPRNTDLNGQLTATDVDLPAQNLTFSIVSQPASGQGTVSITGTNPRTGSGSVSFLYDANSTFVGTTSFTYRVTDNGTNPSNLQSNIATVFITVTPVNTAPTTSNGTNSTNEDTSVSGTLSASDPDGNPLTYILVSQPTGSAGGTVTITNTSTGAYTYVPAANASGTAAFTFKVNDGTVDSNTSTVTITVAAVNDAPVVVNGTASGNEDSPITGDVSIGSSDIDSSSRTYAVVGTPVNGTVNLNPNGTFTFTPASNFSGTASFQFRATDNGTPAAQSNVGTMTITVNAVNDNPVITSPGPIIFVSVPENTTPVATVITTDIDSTTATFSLSPVGSDNLQNAEFTITPIANTRNATLAFTGSGRNFEDPQGSVAPGNPTYFVQVRVEDGSGGFDEQLYQVTLTNANDPPVANADTLTAVNEDSGTRSIPFADLLANDTTGAPGSNDGAQTLTITGVSNAVGGTVSLDSGNSVVNFTPAANFAGTASFSYTLQDSGPAPNTATGNVTFTVTGSNDAPVVNDQTFAVVENSPNGTVVGTLVATDPDAGATLSYFLSGSAFAINQTTGVITVADQNQIASSTATPSFTLTATVTDGTAQDTAVVTINVTPPNAAPVITSTDTATVVENTTAVKKVTATDANAGQTLTFSIVTVADQDSAKFTINPSTGDLSFVSPPNFEAPNDVFGADNDNVYGVTVRVTDSANPSASVEQTITVTVTDGASVTGPVYVNAAWAGFTNGTSIADPDPTVTGEAAAIFGTNAFANVQGGAEASATKTITLLPGTYPGDARLNAGAVTTGALTFNVPTGEAIVSGVLSGPSGVVKTGAGKLFLTGANTYVGDNVINNGRLSISLNSQLGDAANNVIVNSPGVFESTGTWTSGRTFFLNNGATLNVASGTFNLNGASINGGFISGPGIMQTTGGTTTFTGNRTTSSLTLNANETATFNAFENGGTLNLAAGKTFTATNFENVSGGKLNVNGTFNVSDFVTNAQMTVSGTGTVVNGGTAGVTFGGGSVTRVDAGGLFNLGTGGGRMTGARVINAGSLGGSGTLVVSFGSLLTNSGTLGPVVTELGGQSSSGNSPGTGYMSDFNLNGGGTFLFEIANATGTEGAPSGWDRVIVQENIFNSSPKTNITATPDNKFNINIVSLLDADDHNTPGPAANFNPRQAYSWRFIDGSNPNVTVTGTFDPAAFNLETTGFLNPIDGTFSVASNDGGKTISIVYMPAPIATIATTTTLTASPTATTGGTLVTLTATVAPSPDAVGSVTFLDNGIPIASGANVPVSGGVATFTTTLTEVGSHSLTANYTGNEVYLNSTSNAETVVVGSPATPPQVLSVETNGNLAGFSGDQHSRVVNLTVVFDQAVALDANAMALTLHANNVSYGGVAQANGYGSLPTSLDVNTTDNITWTVTFSGNTEVGADGFASLKDGVYNLNIDGSKVHPIAALTTNMGGALTTTFHRLFGDSDAPNTPTDGTAGVDFQAVVNTGDNLKFRNAFNNPANYNASLDYNGDGTINTGDNLQFRSRFNKGLTWSV
jgi:autotransporter-associated beta strand protein/VCBS repeat-containing protein